MIRPTVFDLNSVELKYYPFMISLDKCNGSCKRFISWKMNSEKTKNINVKEFNMITNDNNETWSKW